MNYQNLSELLSYLAGPVGALACAVYVSNLVRNLKEAGKLAKLSSAALQAIVLAASAGIPLIAYAIVQYVPAEEIAKLQDVWAILATVGVSYLVQQGYFQLTKNSSAVG